MLYRERLDKLFEIQIAENRQVFSIPHAFEKSARLTEIQNYPLRVLSITLGIIL